MNSEQHRVSAMSDPGWPFISGTILLGLLMAVFAGCGEAETEIEIPEHIAAIENLTVLDPFAPSVDSLILEQDVEYGSTDEVLISRVHNIAVDDRGRVYVEEGKSGSGTIYVYEPDGTYLTTIGQFGRGPGDLMDTVEMQVYDNELHIYNGTNFPTQISIFSLEDFSFIETILLKFDGMKEVKEFAGLYQGNMMFVMDDRYLMNFRPYGTSEKPEEPRYLPYFFRSSDGDFIPGISFQLREADLFYPERRDYSIGLQMHFIRRPVIAASDSGHIYTAWTEDFLIEMRNQNGENLKNFYHPYKKSVFTLDELIVDEEFKRLVLPHELPETWPTIFAMFVDEQNRLWVLTYTDSDTHYGGMVINGEGEVLARFQWPGEKLEIGETHRLSEIRDGYLYAWKTDPETGAHSVVRFAARTADGERF